MIKRHPLSLRSFNRYIDKDPDFNSIWMNYQSWNKELNIKSPKRKTKCSHRSSVARDRDIELGIE
jgi:hypothetical protein